MSTKRFNDNPTLKRYSGSEMIPLQAIDGGTDAADNAVAAGDDAKISLRDMRGLKVHAVEVADGTATVDCGHGLHVHHNLLLSGNAMLALENLAPAGYVTQGEIRVVQGAAGSHTLTLPASWKPLGGSDTAIASAANAVTRISFISHDGSAFEYAMQDRVA